MITRGHFIGQIIDELTMVSEQVKSRSRLGINDLSKYLEDFMKDLLNTVLDLKLKNLNEERCNHPGLDLGDKIKKIGFQVTSTKTSIKINETLEKALPQQSTYSEIYVLILQEKQNSYTLDTEKTTPFGFTEKNIWDFNDLFQRIMPLSIDALKTVFELVTANLARVRVELEIPDLDGHFPTEMTNYIESLPTERYNGVASFHRHLETALEESIQLTFVERDILALSKSLKVLPRITRQFYAFLLDRGQWKDAYRKMNCDYLKRVCLYPDWEGEIRLLTQAGLCHFSEPSEYGESGYYYIHACNKKTCHEWYLYELMNYIELKGLKTQNVMGNLDFAEFA